MFYSILFLNLLTERTNAAIPKTVSSIVSRNREDMVFPLRNIPFRMVTKYLAGIMYVIN